jgi:hypothetical protein
VQASSLPSVSTWSLPDPPTRSKPETKSNQQLKPGQPSAAAWHDHLPGGALGSQHRWHLIMRRSCTSCVGNPREVTPHEDNVTTLYNASSCVFSASENRRVSRRRGNPSLVFVGVFLQKLNHTDGLRACTAHMWLAVYRISNVAYKQIYRQLIQPIDKGRL